ncbi:MAG TPA: hypothetical protein P5052_02130 [Candidatus Paceibacterota bacterium]|nr:hypothetical protein [Candidatus Paceibacterota bacterium]HRZ29548.1 hypothetical protein [Candidatus Paceibacterota bacterium]
MVTDDELRLKSKFDPFKTSWDTDGAVCGVSLSTQKSLILKLELV